MELKQHILLEPCPHCNEWVPEGSPLCTQCHRPMRKESGKNPLRVLSVTWCGLMLAVLALLWFPLILFTGTFLYVILVVLCITGVLLGIEGRLSGN